ncbi:MAG: MMPL family transporter [Acidobacteriota bacterium]
MTESVEPTAGGRPTWSEAIGRRVSRWPGRTLAVCLALTAIAALAASHLRLETELSSLLPSDAPAAADYRLFLERFGGFEKAFALVLLPDRLPAGVEESDARRALLTAQEALVQQLAASAEVREVRAGLEAGDEAFFLEHIVPRAPLLIDAQEVKERLDALQRPGALAARVAELRAELIAPTGATRAPLRQRDPLGFADALKLPGGTLPLDPMTSTFIDAEGRAALIILTPARGELDPEGGRALAAELESAFAHAGDAARRASGLEPRFLAIGGPLYAAQDEALVRGDLQLTVVGSLLACALILVLAFQSWTLPLAALGALTAALVWTGGLLAATLGEVTAVGVGFAAVLVGLGVDYGIHASARFRQARLNGFDAAAAVREVFSTAGPPIAASVATTAVGFATLSAAHFRPLRELGLLVSLGIVAILIASATLGAALFLLLPIRPRAEGAPWRALGAAVEALLGLAARRPAWVLSAALITSLAALTGLDDLELSTDLTALRPAHHPVFEAERALVERFGVGLDTTTIVVEGRSMDDVLRAARSVDSVLFAELGTPLDLTSPADWLPPPSDLAQRLETLTERGTELRRLADDLEVELQRRNLAPAAFAPGIEALRALADGRDPAPLDSTAWPPILAELVRSGPEGRGVGAAAALRLRLEEDRWPDGPPPAVLERLQAARPPGGRIAVASVPRFGAELGRLARSDLATLAEIALLLVGLVVVVMLRGRLLACAAALLPVALGVLWSFGAWGAAGLPLDLMSLAVAPILLGIGIDDGLHAVVGARRAGGIVPAVRHAGLAMTLTTLTTAVGFGSLALSSIPGLQRGGLLVAAGVVACWLATLLVLPALASYGKKSG